jgi:hypothetical protein
MKEARMKKCSVLIGIALIFLFPIVSQAQNKYLVIPPSAIRPIDYNFASLDWFAWSDEFYFDSGSPDSVSGNAPVYLPVRFYIAHPNVKFHEAVIIYEE